MLSTLLISAREFLEAFLMIGVFLGISRNLKLKREKEILFASSLGIAISLILPIIVFTLGEKARAVFTHSNTELLEGYLMIFSGFFVAYVIFSLHKMFTIHRSKSIIAAHDKMQKNIFDISLFLTIVFFIMREGVEIALFTATTSLFSTFTQNFTGLIAGFAISALLGSLTFFAYIKFPIAKVFKYTEYMIVMLGAALVSNGLGELFEIYFDIHLSDIFPVSLGFLPDSETVVGGILKTMLGVSREFSLAKLAIISAYVGVLYLIFIKTRKRSNEASAL